MILLKKHAVFTKNQLNPSEKWSLYIENWIKLDETSSGKFKKSNFLGEIL